MQHLKFSICISLLERQDRQYISVAVSPNLFLISGYWIWLTWLHVLKPQLLESYSMVTEYSLRRSCSANHENHWEFTFRLHSWGKGCNSVVLFKVYIRRLFLRLQFSKVQTYQGKRLSVKDFRIQYCNLGTVCENSINVNDAKRMPRPQTMTHACTFGYILFEKKDVVMEYSLQCSCAADHESHWEFMFPLHSWGRGCNVAALL